MIINLRNNKSQYHQKMKKLIYLTNIEVPYRVRFFNELAKHCDLTVLYERRESSNRDKTWTDSEKGNYHEEYLDGADLGRESSFSLRIVNVVRRGWDVVIVGCYNSKVQMLAMLTMRLLKIPFFINLDGEPFIDYSLKGQVKKFFLKGAKGYLIAGVKAGESLKANLGKDVLIIPYWFSSLSDEELQHNRHTVCERQKVTVLVIGQYYDYKGMDVAFQAACHDQSIKYKFVGIGKRSGLFQKNMGVIPENIVIIPFLQKKGLEEEYRKCSLMVLPSRQECWGLVINEAASFGTPVVSTWGSGAAVEFLSDEYPQYLAKAGDAESLYNCIKLCLESDNNEYSNFLKEKSVQYSIERSVRAHIDLVYSDDI